MIVHMITDTHPEKGSGGGELHLRTLIRIGEQLGHKITIYTSLDQVGGMEPDLYWLCNMNGKHPYDQLLEKIGHTKYIFHDDAYMSICPQPTREYKLCFSHEADIIWEMLESLRKNEPHPSSYDIELDIHQPHMWQMQGGDGAGYVGADSFKTLYEDCKTICRYHSLVPIVSNAQAMVVDSPLHGGIWSGIYPQLRGKLVTLDPPVPVDNFMPRGEKVPGTAVYVGTIAKGKGFDKVAEFARNRNWQLSAIGDIHHTIDPAQYKDYVTFYGHISYESVANFIGKTMYLLHLPEWPEPQGRIITEGLLMGCIVVGNRRVGALSYPWLHDYVTISEQEAPDTSHGIVIAQVRDMEGYRNRIHRAPYKFWEEISMII